MTTLTALSPRSTPLRTLVQATLDAPRWIRETPAPRWEGNAARKATFAGYVGASMIAWTLLGMSVSAGLGALLSAVS